MFNKIFSAQTKTITGAALILGAASFASRVIGLIRDRILAHQFGAGDTLDAYYAAFRIPDMIYNLIVVGALAAGFIPIFTKLYLQEKNKAWELTSNIVNLLGGALLFVCAIFFIFAPQITPYLVPGFDAKKILLTATLTRAMLIGPILLGISGIIGGALQSIKAFLIYSLAPIVYNFGIIGGAVFFTPIVGPIGLAYGVVLGSIFHLIIQIPTLIQHGYHYQFTWNWRDKAVREVGRLMIPRNLALAVGQLNWLVITVLASTLPAGSLTIFNFANNIQFFPIGIIGLSFAIAVFPTLSESAARNDLISLKSQLSKTARQILFFIIPLSLIFILLRAQIIRVILGTGQFDWRATIETSDALALFSLSLFAQCLIPLLARGFFALRDTWTPFVIAFISALINIIFCLVLKNHFGTAGLAMAFSLAAIFQLAVLWISLRHRTNGLDELPILHFLYKITLAGMAMALVIQLLKWPISLIVNMDRFWGILTQGLACGLIGTGIYLGLCLLLKVEEIYELKASLQKRWLKINNLPSDTQEVTKVE